MFFLWELLSMLPGKIWRQRGGQEGPRASLPPLRAPDPTRRAPLEWGGKDSWTHTHLAFHGALVPVLSPVHTIVTIGHLVGCHILDVAKVSGSLGDDAGHSLLRAQVNLQEKKKSTPSSLLGPSPVRWEKADTLGHTI